MKVLIVYSSAGSGHRRAAEAIYEDLKDRLKSDSCLVDILSFTSPFFKFIYSDGYTFLIKKLPWVWSFFYWLTDRECLAFIINASRKFTNFIFARRFFRFVQESKPEVVVSTHFMPNEIVSDLKLKGKLSCYLISIITDYTAHSFWISAGVDRYVVALEAIRDILADRGVDKDKTSVLGIPVDRKFFGLKTRPEAAKIISLNPSAFSALLVTGTIALSALGKIAKLLKDEMQLAVICGTNKKLREYLNGLASANIFTFPIVDNMHDFLAANDIIVTKAGGLTISECLITQTPMFFIAKVLGQEAENIKALCSLGCAVYEPDLKCLAKRILEIRDNPQTLAKMKQNLRRVAKFDVNDKVVELVASHVR